MSWRKHGCGFQIHQDERRHRHRGVLPIHGQGRVRDIKQYNDKLAIRMCAVAIVFNVLWISDVIQILVLSCRKIVSKLGLKRADQGSYHFLQRDFKHRDLSCISQFPCKITMEISQLIKNGYDSCKSFNWEVVLISAQSRVTYPA